jgi:hypothetical protein
LKFWDTSAIVSLFTIEAPRLSAETLLARHPLRAADSLQLAAALAWREGHPGAASFVTLDRRLKEAAAIEGFRTLPYIDEVHDSILGSGMVFELRDPPVIPYGSES